MPLFRNSYRHSGEQVTLLGYRELLISEGMDRFPKEYPIKVSRTLIVYIVILTSMVFYDTFIHPFESTANIIFDICYFAGVFFLIICQLPIAVVREREHISIRFCLRRRKIPIEEIEEIRIVSSSSCREQLAARNNCRKCVWGFPTRMDQTIYIYTGSSCNNYQLGLLHVEEFLSDNKPRNETLLSITTAMGSAVDKEMDNEVGEDTEMDTFLSTSEDTDGNAVTVSSKAYGGAGGDAV